MFTLFTILAIIAGIGLAFVVVVQNSKGGGLSSTLGGSAVSTFGARRSNEFIEKLTWYLVIAVAVFSFMANTIATPNTGTPEGTKAGEFINDPLFSAPAGPPAGPTQQVVPTPAPAPEENR